MSTVLLLSIKAYVVVDPRLSRWDLLRAVVDRRLVYFGIDVAV